MRDLSSVVVEEVAESSRFFQLCAEWQTKTLVSVGSQSEGARIEAEKGQWSKLASFRQREGI